MNYEGPIPYRRPGVKKAVEQASKEAFYTRPPTEESSLLKEFLSNRKRLYRGLGVDPKELSADETHKLDLFIDFAAKRILNAAVNREGIEYQSSEEVIKALTEHAKDFSNLTHHDLIHAMVAYKINSTYEPRIGLVNSPRRNSPVPEFLLHDGDAAQAMVEELPALLWTAAFDETPPLSAIRAGNVDKVLEGALDEDSLDAPSDDIAIRIRSMAEKLDTTDFNTCLTLFVELVLGAVKTINENKLSELEEPVRSEQAASILSSYENARSLFKRELEVGGPSDEEGLDRVTFTMRFFIEKARIIFENEPSDTKTRFHEFMEMGEPLIERLERASQTD